MSSNTSSLVKTSSSSFNSEISTKKCPTSNGLLNLINRSNNKSTLNQIKKSKLYSNKRFSADIESLSNKDIDKVTINRQKELQSIQDNNNIGKVIMMTCS